MGCCCNRGDEDEGCYNRRDEKNNDREIPEGIEPCCHNMPGPRWMCLPYNDGWVIASVVLSIVATFFSWVYYPVFVFSLVGMLLFQLLWSWRSSRFVMYGLASAAMLVSLESLGVGIYAASTFRTAEWCYPWDLYYAGNAYQDDDLGDLDDFWYTNNDDNCLEWFLAGISFFCSALWIASAASLFWFVKSGRHARWEKMHVKKASVGNSSTPSAEVDAAEAVPDTESEAQLEPVMETDRWMI